METIEELTGRFPHEGRVEWIGIRPERRAPLAAVNRVRVLKSGLEGDHRNKEGARAVTLIQHEHLPAIASLSRRQIVDPGLLRRNIVVSGISLSALKHRKFRLGAAILKGVEACAPCSRMEEALGPGGYNAMRGHGGLCAAVLEEGVVQISDPVRAID